ncbi:N-acetyllactosaminide beta-1,6-N-acetylglucosaminyl-transferase [Aplysia californica]|uniref:N-acetyllactosaminide beta-1,6-N-acetylglucosaminyl-transferase n=1 Tax=Aplysia californica TaxID=6500 RepID=A0ABM1VPL4_APLCA|nr:N-acetyllactosaminide beta-1,6-N-acetylglucosaminyl-transferase [Aplysia californica]
MNSCRWGTKYRVLFLIAITLCSLTLFHWTMRPLPLSPLDQRLVGERDVIRSFQTIELDTMDLVAHKNGWVGFQDLKAVDCTSTLTATSVDNSQYPQSVPRVTDAQIEQDAAADCPNFNRKYGFQRYPEVTEEESDFPLAFIILFYKDLDQILFLLRAIYRPQNAYCLSVDLHSPPAFIDAVKAVTRCLPNVFLASKLEYVVYSGFTRLMSDIHCMRDLVKHPVPWKYVINMPGQQFPLRTNLEMVQILKLYRGANDIEGMTGKRLLHKRFRLKHRYQYDGKTGRQKIVRTGQRNPPPPHNLMVVKGSAYGTYSRAFVDFALNSPVSRDLLEWANVIESPDEYFWATLNHATGLKVPGGYTEGPPDQKQWVTTFASWDAENPCATKRVRWICIFSTADLPMLLSRQELFANKFYITHHPAALHCLDQMLYNMTVTGMVRDLDYYRKLKFVKRHTEA